MSKSISHWIDNKPFAGSSGSHRAGDQPGDR